MICPSCGAEVVKEQENTFTQADFSEPPKKKKGLKVLIIVGVILAVLGALTAIFWNKISKFVVKTVGSPEAYFAMVEKEALTEMTDELTMGYGRYISGTANGAKGELKLTVSDTLLELAQLEESAGIELDWLKELALEYETGVDGGNMMALLALKLAGQKVLDISTIMSADNQMYVGVPMLTDKYLTTDLSEMMGTASMSSMMMYDDELLKALPDEETLNKLIKKYIDVAFEQIDGVDKSSETLEIGDVEQKVTALEYKITEKDALKITKAILKEAKGDKDLKKVIENVAKYFEEQGLVMDSSEVYDSFVEGIEALLEEMDDVETSSDSYVLWTTYVDGASEVVGRTIEVDGEKVFEYATATKGKNYATELKIMGEKYLEGEGTISGGIRKGDYVLQAQGQELLNVEMELNEKNTGDGNIDVKLVLRPSDAVLSMAGLDSQVLSMIQSMNLGLELRLVTTDTSSEMEINAVGSGTTLLGLALKAQMTDVNVTIPSSADVIDAADADQWVETLDLDALISALKQANVPEDLVSVVEYYAAMMAY